MKRKLQIPLISLAFFASGFAYSMDIESFENLSAKGKGSIEYKALRLWADGLFEGAVMMKGFTEGDEVEGLRGYKKSRICMPERGEPGELLIDAGKAELASNRNFYTKSKFGIKFPMMTVVWIGLEKKYPCPSNA